MSAILHLLFAVVFGIMLWTTLRHRGQRSQSGDAPRESLLAELIWSLLPVAIFYALVWPSLKLVGGN